MAKTAVMLAKRPLAAWRRAHQAVAQGAQTNSLDDFQALAARHEAAMYRVAYRLTGNRDDALDLAQECLIEAFRAFDRFQIGTRFDLWVYRIMVRTFIDKFKRRKRLNAVSLEEIGPGEAASLADAMADPRAVLEQTVWSERVQAALDRLAPDFRAAVVLCDAQGLSYEEASRALGCPVGTVRSRLHRARDQLRRWLRPLLEARED